MVVLSHIPPEIVQSWEADFGSDPDYWLLRFSCISGDVEWNPNRAAFDAAFDQARNKAIEDLQYAYSKGKLDANGILVLLFNTGKDISAQKAQAMLNEAVRSNPEKSWPYYYRALTKLKMGDKAGALADFQSGNAAADNAFPKEFPRSVYDRAVMTGKPSAAKRIFQPGFPGIGPVQTMAIRRTIRNNISVEDFKAHPVLYSAIHEFLCRLAKADLSFLTDSFASMEIDYLAEQVTMNPSLQDTKVSRSANSVGKLCQQLRTVKDEIMNNRPQSATRYWMILKALHARDQGNASELMFAREARDFKIVRRRMWPLIDALYTFDYANGDVAPEMQAALDQIKKAKH